MIKQFMMYCRYINSALTFKIILNNQNSHHTDLYESQPIQPMDMIPAKFFLTSIDNQLMLCAFSQWSSRSFKFYLISMTTRRSSSIAMHVKISTRVSVHSTKYAAPSIWQSEL